MMEFAVIGTHATEALRYARTLSRITVRVCERFDMEHSKAGPPHRWTFN